MKEKLFALLLGSSMLLMGLLSCSSPIPESDRLDASPGIINLVVTDGRTLAPVLDLAPSSYEAQFTHASFEPVTSTFTAASAKTVSLQPGVWNLTLIAKNQGGASVGSATKSVTITSGVTTSVSLTLLPIAGQGSFKLVASLVGVEAVSPTLSGKLTPIVGGDDILLSFNTVDANPVALQSLQNGSYTLEVILKAGTTEIARGTDAVYIVANSLTEAGLSFKVVGTDYLAMISMDIPVDNKVVKPALNPVGGLVPVGTTVTFTSSTPSAILRYTLDGSEPTATSTPGDSVVIQSATNLKVKAFKTGMVSSETASGAYTVPGVTYDGIKIYITSPLTHVYTWAMTFDSGATVMPPSGEPGIVADAALGYGVWKAVELPKASKASVIGKTSTWSGKTPDLLVSAKGTYWIDPATNSLVNYDPLKPVEPVITATPDSTKIYDVAQSIILKSSNADDVIHFTVDGSTPTAASPIYTAPFTIAPSLTFTTVKAFGINRESVSGAVATFVYDIKTTNDVTPPSIGVTVPAGTYPAAQAPVFTITDDKIGVKAYYTTNGDIPTVASTVLTQTTTSATSTSAALSIAATTRIQVLVRDTAGNEIIKSYYYRIGDNARTDFRQESIYFLMTTRFFDGDASNNFNCWSESEISNPVSDPAWRGDFNGLVQKLDYIKALGFSAIWVTPPVKNASGLDYHGYHAVNFKQIDPRYKSSSDISAMDAYQKFIDAAHARGMKVIQDIVLNHSSNFGEENLFPLYEKNADGGYKNIDVAANMIPNAALIAAAGRLAAQQGKTTEYILANQPYPARLEALKTTAGDPTNLYKHGTQTVWNSWLQQEGDMAGDCRELNTENSITATYLEEAFDQYINMGVDAFRIDTVKHISRVTFNNFFLPHFMATGGENFFMFGECANIYSSVWDNGIPAQSTPHYTWKETTNYPWSTDPAQWKLNSDSTLAHWNDNITTANQPTSNNHLLNGNDYRTPDYTRANGLSMIDFVMHHNFANAGSAFNIGLSYDNTYNDATKNVVYVDSHDYGPNNDGGLTIRYGGTEGSLAENMSLMFTFRGIPTIYYGTEVQFQKGKQIEPWGNGRVPFAESGRAYFGAFLEGSVTTNEFGAYTSASGTVKSTLDHPLAKHIANLNKIRRAVPALQMGQYSTEGASGGIGFKRRFTDAGTDSFALVAISGSVIFTGIPNGKYTDAVTGGVIDVTGGSLVANASGQANLRVYVLDTAKTTAPGKVADAGLSYLK